MNFATIRTSVRIRVLAAALSLGPLALPMAVAAQCVAVTDEGLPRECTATEELGACFATAKESRAQCDAAGGGFFRCAAAHVLDDLACAVSFAGDMVFE